jgi:hypothetical protein
MGKKRVPISLRKPPSPEALESFVQSGAAVTETAPAPEQDISERVAAPAPEVEATVLTVAPEPPRAPEPTVIVMPREPERQSVFVGEDGQAMRPITVYLPFPLAEQLGRHCLELDRNVSRVVTDAIEAHLARRLGAGSAWADERRAEPSSSARPASSFVGGFVREWVAQTALHGRVERWLELGRTFLGGLRPRAQTA